MANIKPKTFKLTPKYHSAVTGKFVSPSYAKAHPRTTVKEAGPHQGSKGKK